MKNRKNILKEAGVLLVAAILVLTAIGIVPMTMAKLQHDVGVSEIISPPTSGVLLTYPVNVTVKNYGENTETTDVQVEIIKWETIMSENFSDPWVEDSDGDLAPPGWETDYWNQSLYTNNAGGTEPEARVYKYDQYPDYYGNYIMSETVNTGTYDKIKLEFNFAADIYDPQYPVYFYVKWTNDSGYSWNDITPWDNPIISSFGQMRFDIPIYFGPGGGGTDFQVKWEYIGYWYFYNYFYLDDVEIKVGFPEYAEIVDDVTIPKDEEVVVNFSYWTLSGCGDGEYQLTAFTLLEDYNSSNDSKTVDIIVSVDPVEMIKELINTIAGMNVGTGVKSSLTAFLNTAKGFLTPPNVKVNLAIDQLDHNFLPKVIHWLNLGKLTSEQAALLTNAAQSIIDFLTNCYQ